MFYPFSMLTTKQLLYFKRYKSQASIKQKLVQQTPDNCNLQLELERLGLRAEILEVVTEIKMGKARCLLCFYSCIRISLWYKDVERK